MANKRSSEGFHSSDLYSRSEGGKFLGYSYTQGTDEKGHRSPLKAYFPPQVPEIVENLVASRKLPFRSSSHLIRHLVYSNDSLEDLVKEADEPSTTTLWGQVRSIERIIREEEAQAVFESHIQRFRVNLSRIRDDPSYAAEKVKELYEEAKQIPNDHWRSVYVKGIEVEFGHYLSQGSGS